MGYQSCASSGMFNLLLITLSLQLFSDSISLNHSFEYYEPQPYSYFPHVLEVCPCPVKVTRDKQDFMVASVPDTRTFPGPERQLLIKESPWLAYSFPDFLSPLKLLIEAKYDSLWCDRTPVQHKWSLAGNEFKSQWTRQRLTLWPDCSRGRWDVWCSGWSWRSELRARNIFKLWK